MDWAVVSVCQVLSATLLAALLWKILGAAAHCHASSAAAQGGWYTLKYWIAYLVVGLLKCRRRRGGVSTFAGAVPGLGAAPASQIDAPRPLLVKANALDSASFCGFDRQGNWLEARIGRRRDGRAEISLTLGIAGDGLYDNAVLPETLIDESGEDEFTAGNLKLEVLEDRRRWRITFNGPLRKLPQESLNNEIAPEKELSYVRFTLIWEALSGLYCSDNDTSTSFAAAALAGQPWTAEYFEHLTDLHLTRHEQIGGLQGSVSIEGREPKRLKLRGFRDRCFGVWNWTSIRRYVRHFIVLEDGVFILLSVVDFPGCFSRIASGCIFMPNSERLEINWTSIQLDEMGDSGRPPTKYLFDFTAGGIKFQMKISLREETISYYGADRASKRHEVFVDATCNSNRGVGIAEFFYRNEAPCLILETHTELSRPIFKVSATDIHGDAKYVVSFDEDICCDSDLVGGKAFQLGVLTKIQKQEGFIVPRGICLTTHAFNAQVSKDSVLKKSIEELELIASGQLSDGDLTATCNAVVAHVKNSSVLRDVQLAVAEGMIKAFDPDLGTKLFAVRSSAVGEDGTELSSAGQMVTLLGVRGDSQSIAAAVLSCWASQYAFHAVEYKRQYGQRVSSEMGVIIQEMVESESSGVLFTRDAVTGNPSIMNINANFGLGESVVSGVSEPDTIRVIRCPGGKLNIVDRHVGSKAFKMQVKVGGGTEAVSTISASNICCLKDEVISRLCFIGLRIEDIMGGARDVEWALVKNDIYLLQARPVTAFSLDEEYDIIHEFDSPNSREDEFCTFANVSEVLPGAITPLSITAYFRSAEMAIQRSYMKFFGLAATQEVNIYGKISCWHGCVNMHGVEVANENRNILVNRRTTELSLAGQTLPCMTDFDVNSYNMPLTYIQRIINAANLIYSLWTADEALKYWEKELQTYTITSSTTSNEIYNDIEKKLPDLNEVIHRTMLGSLLSMGASQALLGVLRNGKTSYTQENYQDIAQLLACCDDVLSATVPVMLKDIADIIRKQEDSRGFTAMSVQDATHWLLSGKSSDAGKAFRKFLEVHGHRCVREFELFERSWAQTPTTVVATIQAIAARPATESAKNQRLSIDVLLNGLKTPLSSFSKAIIKRILPKAWQSVGRREWSKSLQVKMNDYFKQSYWKLAAAMKREGRIPDEELLFFFTHKEIGKVLKTRSARLISRAQKRKKLYPEIMKLKFLRDHIGHPEPISTRRVEHQALLQMTGMPVSLGTVRGRARVILDVESASSIKSGEILIVPFTDIGWSPYFPLISGLVTEIGGMISHGAVIAREYGIPCIVNCPGVMENFTTGDFVELSGSNGTIRKLQAETCH